MPNYNTTLQSNNTDLQAILDSINELPEAGGVELPALTNEGVASYLLSGKQLIDGDGNRITGTFSIDNELTTQDSLIAQIQAAVDSLPEAGGGDSELNLQTKTVTPTASSQTITPDSGYGGLSKVTINGDSDLVAGNIRQGVNIFGINGTYVGGGGSGSIETVSITFNVISEPGATVYYIDNTMTLQSVALIKDATYNVAKGTILAVTDYMSNNFPKCEFIYGSDSSYLKIFKVTGEQVGGSIIGGGTN